MKNVPKIGRVSALTSSRGDEPAYRFLEHEPGLLGPNSACDRRPLRGLDGFVGCTAPTRWHTPPRRLFMLPGLAKPVVLNGKPAAHRRDPRGRHREPHHGAADRRGPHRGRRAHGAGGGHPFGAICGAATARRKVSSTNFGAFQSFNYPPLAVTYLHYCVPRAPARPARCGRVAGAGASMDDAGVGGVSVSRHHRRRCCGPSWNRRP